MQSAYNNQIVIREACDADEIARRTIIDAATQELRRIYRPQRKRSAEQERPICMLVAVDGESLLGTAEYIVVNDDLYIQGIAIHPDHRRRGVCRLLIAAIEELAQAGGLHAMVLSVIEETGNIAIFEKMGFNITSRSVSSGYISPSGDSVTQVEMERKIVY